MYWAMIDFSPRGRNIRNHIAWRALNLIFFLPFYWNSPLPINQLPGGPHHQPGTNMMLLWNRNIVVILLRFPSLVSQVVKYENVTLTKFWSMNTPEMIFLFHWKQIMVYHSEPGFSPSDSVLLQTSSYRTIIKLNQNLPIFWYFIQKIRWK